MSNPNTNRVPGLLKHKSWSPDTEREEAWVRRRGLHRAGGRRSRSVTDDDLDELRGCIDLGFGFEAGCGAGCGRSRLAQTFPALDLYYAVNGGGGGGGCLCGAGRSPAASDAASAASEESPVGSPLSILSPGDTPEMVKMRLKQWAQVVAWSVRNRG